MIKIEYPPYQPKIKEESGKEFIFDEFPKRWVLLTPEEWVRQHFMMFLIYEKKYPKGLFAIEKEHVFNNMKMRADLIVYKHDLSPWLICEFKAPEVAITQEVFYQVARYNLTFDVPYLVVSNGLEHFCCRRVEDRFEFQDDIPDFETVDK